MKILFIGNRWNVLNVLLKNYNYELIIYVLIGSSLENKIKDKNIKYNIFSNTEKSKIIDIVLKQRYDILISNGCPFILPIVNKIMINIHPTYLPYLRGKTPLNGVFYNNMNYIGATMHYISDKIDGGNIIYQEKHKITDDLDQGLIYFLSFFLEGVVFKKGWDLLLSNNFNFEGIPIDLSKGTYFNRTEDKATIDFQKMKTDDIIRIIKSFGVESQGVKVNGLVDNKYKIVKIFDANKIINSLLIDLYKKEMPGNILLNYGSKKLVKTIDGIIKIIQYE
jgi:methionyl-tRNA formyltransferase